MTLPTPPLRAKTRPTSHGCCNPRGQRLVGARLGVHRAALECVRLSAWDSCPTGLDLEKAESPQSRGSAQAGISATFIVFVHDGSSGSLRSIIECLHPGQLVVGRTRGGCSERFPVRFHRQPLPAAGFGGCDAFAAFGHRRSRHHCGSRSPARCRRVQAYVGQSPTRPGRAAGAFIDIGQIPKPLRCGSGRFRPISCGVLSRCRSRSPSPHRPGMDRVQEFPGA